MISLGYTNTYLNFEGANNSTSFVDATGRVWTAGGTAKISTAQFKYGSASGYFDGAGWVETNGADFSFRTYDYMIDFYLKLGNLTTDMYVLGQCNSSGGEGGLYLFADAFSGFVTLRLYVFISPSWHEMGVGNLTITDTNWHHIAISIDNMSTGVQYLTYKDGVQKDGAAANFTPIEYGKKFVIGRKGEASGSGLVGYLDEFRVTYAALWRTYNTVTPNDLFPEGYMYSPIKTNMF